MLFLRSRVCHRKLRKILQNQTIQNGRILDAGCGEGQYLVPLACKYSEMHFTGIDRKSSHIDFLRKLKTIKSISNCTLLHETISSHLKTKITYDLIYIIGVLQYTSHPHEIIRTCARSLRSSGQLMIYTPIKTNLHFSLYTWIKGKYGHYDDAQKEYQPIEESHLLEWINSAGFHITQKEYHYGYTGTLGHEIMQSLLILATHWPGVLKIIPFLFFIILIPIFVSLQIVDDLSGTESRKRGNGLFLILQK